MTKMYVLEARGLLAKSSGSKPITLKIRDDISNRGLESIFANVLLDQIVDLRGEKPEVFQRSPRDTSGNEMFRLLVTRLSATAERINLLAQNTADTQALDIEWAHIPKEKKEMLAIRLLSQFKGN